MKRLEILKTKRRFEARKQVSRSLSHYKGRENFVKAIALFVCTIKARRRGGLRLRRKSTAQQVVCYSGLLITNSCECDEIFTRSLISLPMTTDGSRNRCLSLSLWKVMCCCWVHGLLVVQLDPTRKGKQLRNHLLRSA